MRSFTRGGTMIWKRGLIVMALVGLTYLPANASTLTFTFTSDHCTGGCSTGAPNMHSLIGSNGVATSPTHVVVGSSQMAEVMRLAQRAAVGDAKVLITGESGVGKDVVAREIHAHSTRARGPFVAVNCAGLTETLLESELFGHVKGSFTGAYRDKVGKLQMADRGTLFLDEVGEMSLRMIWMPPRTRLRPAI